MTLEVFDSLTIDGILVMLLKLSEVMKEREMSREMSMLFQQSNIGQVSMSMLSMFLFIKRKMPSSFQSTS